MNKNEMNALEKEIVSFDFAALEAEVNSAQMGFATAASAADVKDKICSVWSKIRKFVKMAENIPFVGKYISLLSNLLDAICGGQ